MPHVPSGTAMLTCCSPVCPNQGRMPSPLLIAKPGGDLPVPVECCGTQLPAPACAACGVTWALSEPGVGVVGFQEPPKEVPSERSFHLSQCLDLPSSSRETEGFGGLP